MSSNKGIILKHFQDIIYDQEYLRITSEVFEGKSKEEIKEIEQEGLKVNLFNNLITAYYDEELSSLQYRQGAMRIKNRKIKLEMIQHHKEENAHALTIKNILKKEALKFYEHKEGWLKGGGAYDDPLKRNTVFEILGDAINGEFNAVIFYTQLLVQIKDYNMDYFWEIKQIRDEEMEHYTDLVNIISQFPKNNIIITLIGDVMIGRSFNGLDNYDNIIGQKVKAYLKNSDLVLMNLETTLTESQDKYQPKTFNFKLLPKYADKILKGLNKNVFASIGNNHILDFKIEGLKETQRTLDKLNIKYTGAGSNLEEAQRLKLFHINDTTIGVLAAADHYDYWAATHDSPGIWYINPKRPSKQVYTLIKQAKEKCDLLIFSCHMQSNYVTNISKAITKFYRSLISNGVDIVHGHSPHHILPVVKYKEGYICYSLGDFIDDYAIDQEFRNDIGLLIEFHIKNKKIIKTFPIKVLIKDQKVNFH